MAAGFTLGLLGLPFQRTIGFADLIGQAIGAMLLVPYYGYAYQVKIGNALLWKVSFALLVVLYILSVGPMVYSQVIKIASGEGMWLMRTISVSLGLFLIIVLAIPPFRYAFKSKKLWDEGA